MKYLQDRSRVGEGGGDLQGEKHTNLSTVRGVNRQTLDQHEISIKSFKNHWKVFCQLSCKELLFRIWDKLHGSA